MKRRGLIILAAVVLSMVALVAIAAAADANNAEVKATQALPAIPFLADGTPTPGATKAPQAYLGVTIANIDQNLQTKLNLSQSSGVVITSVAANSPAATAGLKAGDVVIAVNGTPVSTAQDVTNAVRSVQPGAQINLSINRAGTTQTVTATAGTAPAGAQRKGIPELNGRLFTLPPELQNLEQGVAPADRFSHNLGSTRTLKDKDGNVVTIYNIPGVVKAISANSITITPNNPQSAGGPFSIDSTTRIVTGAKASGTDAVAVNDQVTVVTVGTSNHASIITKGGVLGGVGRFLGDLQDGLQQKFGNFLRGLPNGQNNQPVPGPNFRRLLPPQATPVPGA